LKFSDSGAAKPPQNLKTTQYFFEAGKNRDKESQNLNKKKKQ